MVSVWPTVDNRTESYREMRENGWLVQTERGLPINMDFLGNTTYFDATHPARATTSGAKPNATITIKA
ncbi:hydrolase [Salmonella enterica subsp. enterica]|nr:hydrolase [Salmonella enterica subsp. enterica] [Salmonella enterica subsp. enterica serovar Menston]